MAVFKCKMCGGALEVQPNATVAECEYCGTQQTLPKTNDDVIANLFNRANNLRLKCEFDKAAQIYEKIVEQDDSEAEAHWGIVLCKYGIEYVEDPKTMTRIPTCHRTLFDAVTTDPDYRAAIDYSDAAQQQIYEREARAIDRIQKDILAVVKNEKPFDVFICYKESDESGKRTVDSSIANDIYHQLTQEGFKVFYAAITLEDKIGQEYEPYIFAALNSAKVMLVLGTKPEYFSAVWVRNEWSRFLQLMKADRSKLLIPCYRDMDAYDLPEEFAHLQAQDMGKIGFINDVVRGIRKVMQTEEPKATAVKETVVTANTNTAPLLKRAFMFLEDGEWNRADEFCEQVLNVEPECAEAYLGKLMADLRVRKQDDLKHCEQPFDGSSNYLKVMRFGDEKLKQKLQDCIDGIKKRAAQLQREREEELSQRKEREEQEKKQRIAENKETIDKEKTERGLWQQIMRLDCDPWPESSEELIPYTNQRIEALRNQIEELANRIKACPSIEHCSSKKKDISLKIASAKEEKAKLEQLAGNCEDDFAKLRQLQQDTAEIGRIWARQQKKLAAMQETVQNFQTEKSALSILALKQKKELDSKITSAKKELATFEAEIAPIQEKAECFDRELKQQKEKLYGFFDSKQLTDRIASLTASIQALEENLDAIKNSDPIKLAEELARYKSQSMEARTALAKVAMEERSRAIWAYILPPMPIAVSDRHAVAIKCNGTVMAEGDSNCFGELNVSDWEDIVAVAVGDKNTVGLKSDGTVVAVGDNGFGACDVSEWRNIVAVAACNYRTVGLKSDGTVVAVGYNRYGACDVSEWRNIVSVAACNYRTVGLRSDGTVVKTRYHEEIESEHFTTADLEHIIAVATCGSTVYSLTAAGTMVDNNGYSYLRYPEWKNIVAITSGGLNVLGLKSDGTVIAKEDKNARFLDKVRKWKGIKLPE